MRICALMVGILVLLSACGTSGSARTTPVPPGAVGTAVQQGRVALTVNHVATPAATDFDTPQAGHHYVVLDISIANNGSEPLDPNNDLRWSITDSTGRAFSDALSSPTTQPPIPTVAPHSIGRGEIGFEVANDAHGLTLAVEVWKHSDTTINIFSATAMAQAMATAAANGPVKPIGTIRVSLGS